MYNRFLPGCPPPRREPPKPPPPPDCPPPKPEPKPPGLSLSGLLERFSLKSLDRGDLLLLLILLLLFSEEEDGWENLLVLGVAFFLS